MTLSYLERGIIMNETLNVLKERRSIRKYKAEQITDAELDAILEAGTWAASGKGLQPAVMVVVQDQETISYMSRLNAEIQGKPGTDPFYGAPTVVVVLADGEPQLGGRRFSGAGQPDDGGLVPGRRLLLDQPGERAVRHARGQGAAGKVGPTGDAAGRRQLHPGLCGGTCARAEAPEGRLHRPGVKGNDDGKTCAEHPL